MRILIILIPISLVLLGIAVWAFIWAVRRGQFDDLDTPSIAMLADDDLVPRQPASPVDVKAPPADPDAPSTGEDKAGVPNTSDPPR